MPSRSQAAKPAPTAGVSAETLEADKSMEGVRVEPIVTAVEEEQEEPIEEAAEEPVPVAAGIEIVETAVERVEFKVPRVLREPA